MREKPKGLYSSDLKDGKNKTIGEYMTVRYISLKSKQTINVPSFAGAQFRTFSFRLKRKNVVFLFHARVQLFIQFNNQNLLPYHAAVTFATYSNRSYLKQIWYLEVSQVLRHLEKLND